MLRSYNGSSNRFIVSILEDFGVKTEENKISLFKYESLTPDSLIWFFSILGGEKLQDYCLYVEDFAPNLEHVIKRMHGNLPQDWKNSRFELVEVTDPVEYGETAAIQAMNHHPKPEDPEEFMKYTAPNGDPDLVFLAQAKHTIGI